MEVEINGKVHAIKEISYMQGLDFHETNEKSGIQESLKKLIGFATDLTTEEVEALSMSDGLKVQKAISDVNKFGDFQNPIKEQKSN